jgi:carbamate kinase
MPRIVLALGGNALLKRSEVPDIRTQRGNARAAAEALAPLADQHEMIITHGNGPQIGLLAVQQSTLPLDERQPLDVLGAESEGLIGYLLERELRRLLPKRKLATILTMVEVASDDPAMATPTKPIGPIYSDADWQQVSQRFGWHGVAEPGGMRRVVPSPSPRAILQSDILQDLLAAGGIPICAGGGGIPVCRDGENGLVGIEAVIDKDWTSARLAVELNADMLVMLTDVDAIYENWGEPHASPLTHLSPSDVDSLSLPPGSMGPKAAAAAWLFRTAFKPAAIGALSEATDVVSGRKGTHVG